MMIPYEGQLKNKILNLTIKRKHRSKKQGPTTFMYCENILTFDIETTSAFIDENGEIILYEKGKPAEYWNSLQPLSLPYIWQFSFDDDVYYGRDFKDFYNLLSDLPKNVNFIIWVHNLAFEFQFLRNIVNFSEIFARSPHKPMKCVPEDFPNIEFRCTYYLTRLSLDRWGKELGVLKATGDLDYNVMRTPLTPLTEKELYYCEMDCRVVCAGIRDYVKRYGKQRDIPLTQTGTVRREVKQRTTSNEEYVKKLKKLVPKSALEYKRFQKIFAGGYTHANRLYSGKLVEGPIEHYDFASSYPTVMVAEKYPMTPFVYMGKEFPLESSFNEYAYMLELHFTNIESISFNTYIQASKCVGSGYVFDNGRVIKAADVTLLITEQDYITIRNNYKWESMEVIHVWRSHKEYLPKEITEYILELYKNKTTLKDVAGKEDIYLQSKQYINSIFGMSVTAIMQSDVVMLSDGTWNTLPLTAEMVNDRLKELKKDNKWEKRYFMSYAWGCWVTAYGRRNLFACLEYCDQDALYADTDSIFVRGSYDFSWYNEIVTGKLKTACEVMGLDFSMTRPKTVKGKEKPLGIFDREDDCSEFISLGAKRYCERRVSDGKLHLTISGINKGAVEMLEDDIENFSDGFVFDKDHPSVTKKLCSYIENMPSLVWPDGYVSDFRSGISLRPTGYKLSITDEYAKLIEYESFNYSMLTEQAQIAKRGRFTI